MKLTPKVFFPVLITEEILACKSFFVSHFCFQAVFDEDWYVHLVHENGAQLGFLVPNHPSQPTILQGSFSGNGLVYSFEVENVDEAFQTLQSEDVEIVFQPKTEAWGQRHFMLAGPAGIIVDVIQNTDASLDVT